MDEASKEQRRNRVVAEAFQCRRALEVYAYSMLKDRAEAEDLVQEAFIVVMEKFEEFQPGTSMLAWTRAIVRFKVLQWLEKRNRRAKILDKLLVDAVDAAFQEAESRDDAEQVRDRFRRLEDCLDKVGERPRKLLNSIYAEGLSYQDGALALDMGLEAAKKSLQRTKAQLRACIRRNSVGLA